MMKFEKLIIPIGFVYGADAQCAVKQGSALALAGGFAAFTQVKVIHRSDPDISFLDVGQLQNINDPEIELQLKNITAKRADFCGLDMSKPHIMAILNITPDSFSDGGRQDDLLQLEQQVDEYIKLGVSILDVGGESTRPNASYVTCAQEIERIAPVLEMLKQKQILISIDTRKAKVMEYALGAGAHIINDVSALEFRADIATYGEDSGDSESLLLQHKCPLILMHSQGTPQVMQNNPHYENMLFEIYDYLQARVDFLTNQNFDLSQIAVDPGIGFGKSAAHCLTILNNLSLFHSLGVALLLGASRKSFIGQIDGGMPAQKRLGGSLAAAHIGLNAGVQIHRMHDVQDSSQHFQVFSAIYSFI